LRRKVNLIEREFNTVTRRLFISTHNIEDSQRLAGTAQGSEGTLSVNKFCHPRTAPNKAQKPLIFKAA
jgi:hypothetical protein